MILNPEEARKRVCPIRVKVRGDPIADGYCIEEKCMAWRWHYEEFIHPTMGYCGLAGKPEGDKL